MNRGYIKLWRKVMENPVLKERGKRYSRFEAWIYLCLMARGTDDEATGLKRGEFEASERFLSKAWLWSKSAVHDYIADLIVNHMITRKDHFGDHKKDHFGDRFTICEYETYNPVATAAPTAKKTAAATKYKEGIKEGSNEALIIPATPKPKPAPRAPADFVVTEELRSWAKQDVPSVDIDFETKKWRDFEYKRAISDWSAAWRNWMRNSVKFSGNGGKVPSRQTTQTIPELFERGQATAERIWGKEDDGQGKS